ncbi:amino acid adenylation domain-containing protein [Amycolatopsis sp. WGS_07]|uniref:amino acid adenylation domain-containing protein n=1 Tax=Amycolatopsis sp. WGS_07 TaxID=3076764 RepID=UPI0038736FAA
MRSKETLHALVQRQASIDGDRIAVVHGSDSINYSGLIRRSHEIAAELLARKVRHGDLVGVCLPRGIDAVAALLAILEVGAVCVPLALEQPPARLAFIREDSGLVLTVTTTEISGEIGIDPAQTVCLDTAIAPVPAPRTTVEVSSDDIAYALYTSGSTGTPKAALLTHANMCNFVQFCLEEGFVDRDGRVVHVNNLGFDAAIFDIFVPLAAGAAVCVAERDVIVSPAATVRWFVENRITAGLLTTKVAEACIAEQWPAETAMRCLVTGGEQVTMWLPPDLPFKVVQAYGPTECTVCAATMFLPPEPEGGGVPSFGKPIRNARIYLLDPSGQPVPDGEPGELYISGTGVGAGYLGRPELTAERFLPDPFAPGERMYRTGDLCRRNADGEFEFLGRMDHQVKLRGHRIELAEIEATLGTHPDVSGVAVIVREDRPGDRRLVAYFTGGEPPAAELRQHLADRLPAYMIPAAYVRLDHFPLTTNNKMDRDALPAPDNVREMPVDYVAPRTAVERDLVKLWEELTGAAPVGVGDEFHALGGDSLMAGRVVEWIRAQHATEIPFSRVLAGATVGELAALIETGSADTAQAPGPTAVRKSSGPVAATSGQFGLWLQENLAPQDGVYNETVLLTIRGQLDPALVQNCLTDLVRRHEALRTCLRLVEGRLRQIVLEPAPVPLELHDERGGQDDGVLSSAQRKLVDALARTPFDLTNGPLLRAALLRSGQESHVLVLVLHHVAVDGWSLDVLFEEFTESYAAASSQVWPPSPSFADFAAWQNEQIQSGGFEPGVSYWRKQLAGAPEVLELPLDHPRPATATGPAAVVHATLAPTTVRMMRKFGRSERLTPFMLVLAAYQAALAGWTASTDIVVGAPLANRPAGFHRTVGYFLNLVPLRTDLADPRTCRELFGEVRDTVLAAHDHQMVPFPHLVDQLMTTRPPGVAPMFQVAIVSQEVQRRTFSAAGIEVEYRHGDPIGAKWDLTLHLIANRGGPLPGIDLELEYRADLFEKETVQRLLDRLCGLLESGLADPDRPIGEWISLTGTRQLLNSSKGNGSHE